MIRNLAYLAFALCPGVGHLGNQNFWLASNSVHLYSLINKQKKAIFGQNWQQNNYKMPRRSELLEEERNYHLVKREKKDDGELIKQVLRFLFSQIGVVILGVVTAALGKIQLTCN